MEIHLKALILEADGYKAEAERARRSLRMPGPPALHRSQQVIERSQALIERISRKLAHLEQDWFWPSDGGLV